MRKIKAIWYLLLAKNYILRTDERTCIESHAGNIFALLETLHDAVKENLGLYCHIEVSKHDGTEILNKE